MMNTKNKILLVSFLEIFLIFLIGCASNLNNQKGLPPQKKDLLTPLIKAGISQPELDSLKVLINTGASDNQIQARIVRFWNGRFQSLTPEEQSTYYGLSDSTDRIGYLSCKNGWERKLFLRKVVKKQKQSFWKTEKDRIFYFSFKLVTTDKELKEYLNLPDSLKQSWLYTFWKKKDPNPTTEENEFKKEFDRRVEYVMYNFSHPFGEDRPWDDRGDVYILYGEPDEITAPAYVFDRAGSKFTTGNDEAGGLEGIRSQYEEVWHYNRYGSFQFQDNKKIGIYTLEPYRRTGQLAEEATSTFLKTITEKVEVAKAQYVPDFGSPLDFPWNWWKFWNSGDYYDVRINLGIPIEKLGLLSDSGVSLDTGWLCFQERIVISDKDRKTISSDSTWIRKKISKYLNRKDLLLVDQYSCDSLSPGFYNIAISIKDSASNRMGIYQDTSVILVSHVKVKASEKISQLIMADSVWEVDSSYLERNGTKFIRNNLVIKPRPGNVYLSGQSPSFYCEIYELKEGEDDSCRCKIYYYFLKKNEKTNKFDLYQGPFTEEATYPSSSQPYIKGSLSKDKFPSGEYIIRIDVYDLNDKTTQPDQTRLDEVRIRKTVVGFKKG